MNTKQKQWLKEYLEKHECTFPVEDWSDFKGVHSWQIENIYQALKKLE